MISCTHTKLVDVKTCFDDQYLPLDMSESIIPKVELIDNLRYFYEHKYVILRVLHSYTCIELSTCDHVHVLTGIRIVKLPNF